MIAISFDDAFKMIYDPIREFLWNYSAKEKGGSCRS